MPARDDATAMLIEGDLNEVGSFACSNDLLNRIYKLTLWSNRTWSMGGYLTEHARERLGYGPNEVMQEPTIMTLDVAALFTKWMDNWLDDQLKDGALPHVSPAFLGAYGAGGGPAWGGTVGSLPWAMYLYYGDRRMLEKCYEPARRYLDFLQSWTRGDLLVREASPGESVQR
jgi:alpha-L-rhamnosidase